MININYIRSMKQKTKYTALVVLLLALSLSSCTKEDLTKQITVYVDGVEVESYINNKGVYWRNGENPYMTISLSSDKNFVLGSVAKTPKNYFTFICEFKVKEKHVYNINDNQTPISLLFYPDRNEDYRLVYGNRNGTGGDYGEFNVFKYKEVKDASLQISGNLESVLFGPNGETITIKVKLVDLFIVK